jgi:hypothetical protein
MNRVTGERESHYTPKDAASYLDSHGCTIARKSENDAPPTMSRERPFKTGPARREPCPIPVAKRDFHLGSVLQVTVIVPRPRVTSA